ncbi:hypothetical protein MTR67_019808 [Solanum verrucosum]|uniref:Uncharacterized protein n=1 Tax=Solanum verrucosum TaxID=315347 RepID=A0AAF0TV60_SOLVR|nr:hypothetical protein MTR67_019808 [Solanum verrucosum]
MRSDSESAASALHSPSSSDYLPRITPSQDDSAVIIQKRKLGKKAKSYAYRIREHVKLGSKFSDMSILIKPHGHGDVHSLLYSSGLLKVWHDAGLGWILFFQDTNGLLFKAIPAALGVSTTKQYHVNSLAVPRKAKETIGGITKLTHKDASSSLSMDQYGLWCIGGSASLNQRSRVRALGMEKILLRVSPLNGSAVCDPDLIGATMWTSNTGWETKKEEAYQ